MHMSWVQVKICGGVWFIINMARRNRLIMHGPTRLLTSINNGIDIALDEVAQHQC